VGSTKGNVLALHAETLAQGERPAKL
jgi:hypothetical protein